MHTSIVPVSLLLNIIEVSSSSYLIIHNGLNGMRREKKLRWMNYDVQTAAGEQTEYPLQKWFNGGFYFLPEI